MTPQAQTDRYAVRLLGERDRARASGDQLAGEALSLAALPRRYPNTVGLLLAFSVQTYADAEGWNGPAATLIKPHRTSVEDYLKEQMRSPLQP